MMKFLTIPRKILVIKVGFDEIVRLADFIGATELQVFSFESGLAKR